MAEITVVSEVTGSVWKVVANVGDTVTQDTPLVIAESMKMEIPIVAPEDGVVVRILVTEGQAISEGEPVATLRA
jgi:acetyl-CoA carboxylase biotin carboxyl carrier protein